MSSTSRRSVAQRPPTAQPPDDSQITAPAHLDLDRTGSPPVTTTLLLSPPHHGEARWRRRRAHPAVAVRRAGGAAGVRGGVGQAEAPRRAPLLRPPLRALLRPRRGPQGHSYHTTSPSLYYIPSASAPDPTPAHALSLSLSRWRNEWRCVCGAFLFLEPRGLDGSLVSCPGGCVVVFQACAVVLTS